MKGINNMKKLIINADDFGYTPGVTAGIIEAHKRGIVTSTTALVGNFEITISALTFGNNLVSTGTPR